MKRIYILSSTILVGIIISSIFTLLTKNQITDTLIEKYDHPDLFAQYYKDITTEINQEETGYPMNYKVSEFKKAKSLKSSLKLSKSDIGWIQRGPTNVGGRTRAIIIDPDDPTHQTWIAGASTGGIWKTTDGGHNWTNISGLLNNLTVNALAMSASNTQIIFAGTGESFPGSAKMKGNGIWKSEDKGQSWTQLESTSTNENFAYVNKIIVDPTDYKTALTATETGIFKTINGGTSWEQVYFSENGVEDLDADPTDFNIIFAGENSIGVLRSSNAGNTWINVSETLGAGNRYEVAVSNVDHNYVYASVSLSTSESNVYISEDNGFSWKMFNDDQHFLGGMGEYNNAISAHPYIADEVFVGGVDVWKLKFNGAESTSEPKILSAYTQNTTFLSFVNFSDYLGGGMSAGDGNNIDDADWVSIEVRFGPNIKQKAHRFTVPEGATSGVSQNEYTFQDYIDIPLEVWDVTNDKQLMVSFRDQENNNEYDLLSEDNDIPGREYLFVNSVSYDPINPDANIAKNGGHMYKNIYMFWPELKSGSTWEPENLPESKIVINYGTVTLKSGSKSCIADSYNQFNGSNSYSFGNAIGNTKIDGLHPDHHIFHIIPTGNNNFTWIDCNDGGIAISKDNANEFTQMPNDYITTQFYGVAKHPSANEYIGGTQDNGIWRSPQTNSSEPVSFTVVGGGDGTECLWHAENPSLILTSLIKNQIRKSSDNGQTWSVSNGIETNQGPFVTKLSVSKENPDMVFAVCNSGIYKSNNFGSSFSTKPINTNWTTTRGATSTHNVEVSLANGKIVWAGGGMSTENGLQIQVSKDYGESFTAVPDYTTVPMKALISGIATHPVDENTAYILFSNSKKPKVLRTNDLGQTWEDISGFETNSTSSNGFPNVITRCLIVMPHNPNVIWVGTDIGLFESIDNGASWHLADNGLPPVSIYDMQIIGNQVVLATHGRGIWTVDIEEIDNAPYISSFKVQNQLATNVQTNLKVPYDKVELYINNTLEETITIPPTGENSISYVAPASGDYFVYIIGYIGTESFKSNTIDLNITSTNTEIISNNSSDIILYPNPSSGIVNFSLPELSFEPVRIDIYSTSGKLVYSKMINKSNNSLNLDQLQNGTYLVVMNNNISNTEKLIIRE